MAVLESAVKDALASVDVGGIDLYTHTISVPWQASKEGSLVIQSMCPFFLPHPFFLFLVLSIFAFNSFCSVTCLPRHLWFPSMVVLLWTCLQRLQLSPGEGLKQGKNRASKWAYKKKCLKRSKWATTFNMNYFLEAGYAATPPLWKRATQLIRLITCQNNR